MKKQAECDDSNLVLELPMSAIRGMCPGIRSDVPNDAEHIQNTEGIFKGELLGVRIQAMI